MDNNLQVCEAVDDTKYVYVFIGYEVMIQTNGNRNTCNTCVCFPVKNSKYPFPFTVNDLTCDDGKSPPIEDLIIYFTDIVNIKFNETNQTVKRLLRVLLLKFTINSNFLEVIIESLRKHLET